MKRGQINGHKNNENKIMREKKCKGNLNPIF